MISLTLFENIIYQDLFAVQIDYTIDGTDLAVTYRNEINELFKIKEGPISDIIIKYPSEQIQKYFHDIDKDTNNVEFIAYLICLKIMQWKLRNIKLSQIINLKKIQDTESANEEFGRCFEKIIIKKNNKHEKLIDFYYINVNESDKKNYYPYCRLLSHVFCCKSNRAVNQYILQMRENYINNEIEYLQANELVTEDRIKKIYQDAMSVKINYDDSNDFEKDFLILNNFDSWKKELIDVIKQNKYVMNMKIKIFLLSFYGISTYLIWILLKYDQKKRLSW